MDTPPTVAIISAAMVVPAISFYLTKSKERQADWQRCKSTAPASSFWMSLR
jgi:hypothetical protein